MSKSEHLLIGTYPFSYFYFPDGWRSRVGGSRGQQSFAQPLEDGNNGGEYKVHCATPINLAGGRYSLLLIGSIVSTSAMQRPAAST